MMGVSGTEATELEIEDTMNELEWFIRVLKVERMVDEQERNMTASTEMQTIMNEIRQINSEIK